MCQLSFADLGRLNPLYMTNQLIINSFSNPDGTGIFNGKEIWRTELAAFKTINLGSCLKLNVHTDPVMGHVRLASNKTLNTKECSHPFGGDRLVLMHNGKLEPKDAKLTDLTKVDSQVFLINFEKWWLDSHNHLEFPDAISEYMKQWEGKFAFLIYDLVDSSYYIIRGNTANLYWTTVNGKLVVNTEQKELLAGINILSQINQVLHTKGLKTEEIKEVEKNTIFKFDPETSTLIKVGNIVENTPAYSNSYGYWQTDKFGVQTWVPYNKVTKTNEKKNSYSSLTNFIRDLGLSISDINIISEIICGLSLVELDPNSWDLLKKEVLESLKKEATHDKLNAWARVSSAGLEYEAYKNHLQFPWMLNSTKKIKEVISTLNDEGYKIK